MSGDKDEQVDPNSKDVWGLRDKLVIGEFPEGSVRRCLRKPGKRRHLFFFCPAEAKNQKIYFPSPSDNSCRLTILVGYSGWSYDYWIGAFYPVDLANKKGEWFDYHAQYFKTGEINGTFYWPPGEFELMLG